MHNFSRAKIREATALKVSCYNRKLYIKVTYYTSMDYKIVLKEQREELTKAEREGKLILRIGLEKAKAYLLHPNIVVILGVRRCGKSIFSYLLAKNHLFGYINFDDERLIGVNAGDLNRILEAMYGLSGAIEYVVLDEIQNVPGWELFANRLRRTKKVIVTGSNSKLLSGELATRLTGRYFDYTLYPFSFSEFLQWKGFRTSITYTTSEKAELINYLELYLQLGGFPETHLLGKEITSRIYNDIITKDILLRYKVKKKEDLRKMAKYLISNFSQEISYSKLSSIIGIKHLSTTSNWISYLEQAFLIIKLERFDYKLKQQMLAPKKMYCIDPGIVTMIAFANSENKGRLMENVVLLELLRQKSLEAQLEIYYWKDHQQHEVDFVVKEGPKVVQLIQVTLASSGEELKEREIRSLHKATLALRCTEALVITWDYERKEENITFIPLWKWLLREGKR